MGSDTPLTPDAIAQALGETETKPLTQINMIAERCGPEFSAVMLAAAQDIHAGEGIPTHDGKRKRTLGGVFFYLVRGALPSDIATEIFPPKWNRKVVKDVMPWDNRADQFGQMIDKPKGKVDDVNITVDGRPSEIIAHNNLVVATLQSQVEAY
ncbi:MAG: hypothetical protein AAF125_03815, partial [Chloroflexota bacterium]